MGITQILINFNWFTTELRCELLTHSIPQNEALVPHSCAPATCGTRPSFREFCLRHLGKHSQTKTSFETNFLPMKGENSITSYCIVLMFKLAKIWRLVKEILVSEALGIYIPWILIASIKMTARALDGCLILNKLGRRRVKIVLENDGNTAMLTVKMWALL